MIQPLHFTTRAIEGLTGFAETGAPLAREGFRYLAGKLRQAQVFQLADHGELLDRSKPRPEMPGLVFQPPFPVVALEYQSPAETARRTPNYTEAPSSRRIAVAWKWTDDLPAALRRWSPPILGEGTVVASVSYFDEHKMWMPVAAAAFLPIDGSWFERTPADGSFVSAMIESGQIAPAVAKARTYEMSLIPLLPEALAEFASHLGSEGMLDHIAADLMDEVNAYTDLCYALACRNVGIEKHDAPARLNKARIKAGKLPFADFHTLSLTTQQDGTALGAGGHAGPRPHLRRGHIRHLRHLGPDRITWVNAAMVRGRGQGFVHKNYSVGRVDA